MIGPVDGYLSDIKETRQILLNALYVLCKVPTSLWKGDLLSLRDEESGLRRKEGLWHYHWGECTSGWAQPDKDDETVRWCWRSHWRLGIADLPRRSSGFMWLSLTALSCWEVGIRKAATWIQSGGFLEGSNEQSRKAMKCIALSNMLLKQRSMYSKWSQKETTEERGR